MTSQREAGWHLYLLYIIGIRSRTTVVLEAALLLLLCRENMTNTGKVLLDWPGLFFS